MYRAAKATTRSSPQASEQRRWNEMNVFGQSVPLAEKIEDNELRWLLLHLLTQFHFVYSDLLVLYAASQESQRSQKMERNLLLHSPAVW